MATANQKEDMKNKAESNASAKQKGRKKNKVQFFILWINELTVRYRINHETSLKWVLNPDLYSDN